MSAIVDYLGRPIKKEELSAEPQTARLSHLHREFGSHPSEGLTPEKLVRVHKQAEQGNLVAQARLAEDMEEKDQHLFAELSKRKRKILGANWDIVPPPDATDAEKKDAASIAEYLQEIDLEDLLFDMADGILKGYSCLEITWAREAKMWAPAKIEHRPADWFMCRPENRNRLLLRDGTGQGVELRPGTWVVHEHKAKSGYLVRAGLARVVAWPYIFRNYAARDFAEFLEIYGLPLRVGTYPAAATDAEKATLMRAVVDIGHAAAGVIPEGMKIEFKEAAQGQSDPYLAMMGWAERSVSKAVVGGTLTAQTDGGSGAYALGEIHAEMFKDIVRSDLRQIARTITRDILRPMMQFNSGRRCPRFVFVEKEAADLELLGKLIPQFTQSFKNLRIKKSWLLQTFRLEEAENAEDALEPAELQSITALREEPGRGVAVLRDTPAGAPPPVGGGDSDDYVAQQVERLQAAADPAMTAMIDQIRAVFDEASSLEEVGERLLELYPELDGRGLTEVMTQALTAVSLAGHQSIRDELA